MIDRLRLGRKLGIPMRILESIEIEVSQRPSRKVRKKVVLERMMSYWFQNDSEASLEKLADSLPTPEKNEEEADLCSTYTSIIHDQVREYHQIFCCEKDESNEEDNQGFAETIRMLIWNAAVEESDIETVVAAIDKSLNDDKLKCLAERLKVKKKRTKSLKTILEAWISRKKVNATWNKLFHCLKKVNFAWRIRARTPSTTTHSCSPEEETLDSKLYTALIVSLSVIHRYVIIAMHVCLCVYVCVCACV